MRSVLEAAASRMIAAEEPGITPRDLRTAEHIVDYIQTLPVHIQRQIKQLLFLFEYLPPFLIFRFCRFSSLAPEDQDRYLEAWGTSRFALLRTGFTVLKKLCMTAYYQDPASWKAIGYER